MATTDIYHISGGLKGRKAAMFIGGDSDDRVTVDAHGVARTAANDTVGTYSAWINVADITGTYTIIGMGDNNVVEFLEFNVEAGKLAARCTDATVAQFVSVTTSVVIKPHQWQHVAFVQNADGRGVVFYVDGVKVASTNSTATDVNEWFNNLDGIDTARIGASNSSGTTTVTNEFKGAISDVKYWNVALSDDEVLADCDGVAVRSSALKEYWDFDGDYVSSGSDATTGTASGDVILSNNYSEFTSRLRNTTGVPVVADSVLFSIDSMNNTGHAIVIQAA